jgi:hypothetical protein
MSRNSNETDAPVLTLKNDSARQRWELFHRAIAHAKKSNLDAMDDGDVAANDRTGSRRLLSIIR